MFPCDNIRKTFTVMHYTVFEHYDALLIAFLVCIILYIDGKQFRCTVVTFVQYSNQLTVMCTSRCERRLIGIRSQCGKLIGRTDGLTQ